MRLLLAAIAAATVCAAETTSPAPTPTLTPELTPTPTPTPTSTPTPTPTPNPACEVGFTCTIVGGAVCASDGIIYDSECIFLIVQCDDPSLEIVADAACNSSSSDSSSSVPIPAKMDITLIGVCQDGYVCQSPDDPICGSDGKTYSNECELAVAQCTDTSLSIASGGSCASATTTDCSATCPSTQDFVCGSDGKTYDNECFLEFAKYCSPGDTSLEVESEGDCTVQTTEITTRVAATTKTNTPTPTSATSQSSSTSSKTSSPTSGVSTTSASASCDDTVCTSEKSYVCGSDGKTYTNKCLLQRAQCSNSKLTLVATGSCSSVTSSSAVGKDADGEDNLLVGSSSSKGLLSSSSSSSLSPTGTSSTSSQATSLSSGAGSSMSASTSIGKSSPSSSSGVSSSSLSEIASSSSNGSSSSTVPASSISSSVPRTHFGVIGLSVALAIAVIGS